ncbi:MAG: MmcQ/YjbR family DNA-binding protein [Oscillospiraceae bacterium]|nr:MmcQ/YjbR family DNA-binding protein [Oscillospiraceae bacterium]
MKKRSLRGEILKYVYERYGTLPEYPWDGSPDAAVLRHDVGGKWYGLLMNVPKSKFGFSDDEPVDVLNLKCDPVMSGSMRLNGGIFPAYHMNKQHWISVLLDGTADTELIKMLIDTSFDLTAKKVKNKKSSRAEE